jgi:hypothetical protein
VRELEENQARNRNSVNAVVNRSFLAASMNPFGLPGRKYPSLVGRDMGSLQSLLESQAAAQAGLLLSGQQAAIFHSLMGGGRGGLDTFSSMTALGGAGLLLEPSSPSNHNNLAGAGAPLPGYASAVGAGGRAPDILTSHHADIATSLQRMARGGEQHQFNRSQQQLDAAMRLFPQNGLTATPIAAADQLMRNAARVQLERHSRMAQRATGIGSLDAAIRPSSRLLGLEDVQMSGGGGGRASSYDTLLRANMRDSSGGGGGADRLDHLLQEGSSGKPPRISKAKEEIRKRAKRKIRGGEDEEQDEDRDY